MTISVCFPYRSDGGRRDLIADWITRRWQHFFPDFELLRGEPGYNQPFNRSQGINRAFKASHGEIIIIADLDTIFNPDDVNAALDMIDDGALWGYGFRGYFNLTEEYSNWVLEEDPSTLLKLEDADFCDWGFENVSGLTFITRQAFFEVGGFDEDFRGWGVEDYGFDRLAKFRLGTPFRVPQGYVLHLWHPHASVDERAFAANQAHFDENYEYNLARIRKWV